MATGMVVSTFVAAPLMFVSGKMLMMPVSDKENWLPLVHRTSFDVGIISLCSVVSSSASAVFSVGFVEILESVLFNIKIFVFRYGS